MVIRKRLQILLLTFSFFASHCSTSLAQVQPPSSVEEIALRAVDTALREQVESTGPFYWAGEWPTKIDSTLVPVLVGVGRAMGQDDEASAFTTGSVINVLASIYLDHEPLQQNPIMQKIPPAILKASATFERYKEGDLFNFYPAREWKGVKVHQPIAMSLAGIWKGFTNIPQDADTSSITNTALTYNSIIQKTTHKLPAKLLESLTRYRDVDRNPYYYNRFEGRRQTGAFLTWQMDENDPKMPHYYFAEPEQGVRIPFNKNDVDCIVNLNVLRMLALHKVSINGRSETCAMINDMIDKKEQATCGLYYPNTFNLAYSAAKANQAGESCISQKSQNQLVQQILQGQSADGGWNNDKNIWNDRIQSTAYAMTALLNFGDLRNRGVQASLRYGASFLLRRARILDSGDVFWNAEVFFTAVAVARSLVVWRSRAYTSLTVAHVLLDMREKFPELDLNYYMHLN